MTKDTMIDEAIAMAIQAHAGQKDKAGRPYILHVLRVAMKFTGDDVMFSAAVLHDAVEDCPSILLANIHYKFGPDVSEIVYSLTKIPGEPYLEKYIPRLAHNQLARVIKREDLYDNLDPSRFRPMHEEDFLRIKKYYKALEMLEKS